MAFYFASIKAVNLASDPTTSPWPQDKIYPGKEAPYQRGSSISCVRSCWRWALWRQGPDRTVQLLELRCPLPAPGSSAPGDAGHLLPGQYGRRSQTILGSRAMHECGRRRAPAGARSGGRRWPAQEVPALTPQGDHQVSGRTSPAAGQGLPA